MLKNKRIYMIPVVGFILLILFFAILLIIPVSTKNGISFFDSIFLATSAITGTGLSTVSVADKLTLIGKIFLIIGVQIGALGFMISFSFILFLRNKKIKFSDAMILSNEINFNNHTKVKERTYNIIKYTFFIEFIGAMLLAIFFVPKYGVIKGIWYGIFHSISAFCNAGFDIFGNNSLIRFDNNIAINLILIFLMIGGSIGFFVIEDICNVIKNRTKHLQVHSKIIITTSFILIVSMTILMKLFSPNLTLLQALFTSTTSRSTGFATFDMASLNSPSKLIISIFMFIGGASGSTAGGIRVTNFAILMLLPISIIKDEELVIGYRKIDYHTILKSVTIVVTHIILLVIAFLFMLFIESKASADLLFELISAFTNTGLSTFDSNELTIIGKAIVVLYMYIGRLGPITFLALFSFKKKKNNSITYPNADLMI